MKSETGPKGAGGTELSGAILIDKPAGISSARAIAQLKRRFVLQKVGHAGTLDPLASGLLVVLVGRATRLQFLFLESTKRYEGVILLGEATTTDDLEGEVISSDRELNYRRLDREGLIEGLKERFTGVQEQVPPHYSAVHVEGERSYKRARRGEDSALAPRQIEITELELKFLDEVRLAYEVQCSKGTYVRALARDIGRALGTFGCIESLRRVQSGRLSISAAAALEPALELEDLSALLIPLERLVSDLPSVVLEEEELRKFCHGNHGSLGNKLAAPFPIACFSPAGDLAGLAGREGGGLKLVVLADSKA